jgi:CDP-glycerol glycerophosphotransferase
MHWVRLLLFGGATLAAIVLRPLRKRRQRKRILFYGHRLAGNLFPIHRALAESHHGEVEVAFMTMDPAYRDELAAHGVQSILAGSCAAIDWLSTVETIVSDHGLHAMVLLLPVPGIRFFDVWHGIPFKGFDARDFRVQHRYDEVWVASPMLARKYVEKFGFDARNVIATGYARTDQLIEPLADRASVRRDFGLPEEGKVLLFAPTWRQDDAGRSLYPFGETEERFLGLLAKVAHRHKATVVVRHHLNSGTTALKNRADIAFLPFSTYPMTEQLLLASDVLVCDWSSIAFDFLLLGRPAIFLDVPPPFAKGFTIDPAARYGAVVGTPDAFERALDLALSEPERFLVPHKAGMADLRARVYGGIDDGRATDRCVRRLLA